MEKGCARGSERFGCRIARQLSGHEREGRLFARAGIGCLRPLKESESNDRFSFRGLGDHRCFNTNRMIRFAMNVHRESG